MFKIVNSWFEKDSSKPDKIICEYCGCKKGGIYRAPKKNTQYKPADYQNSSNNKWHWFCLDHVRAYNRAWNYGDQNIEQLDSSEPYAPSGRHKIRPFAKIFINAQIYKDPLGLFEELGETAQPFMPQKTKIFLTEAQKKALITFGLTYPFSADELQQTYRRLAKEHHPDRNGGCKKSEEYIKQINEGYRVMRKLLSEV